MNLPKDINEKLKKLEKFTRLLDYNYKIPMLNIRIGLDGLLGLLPIAGDTVSLILSLLWVYRASTLKISSKLVIFMLLRIVLDYLIGVVPVAGDIFDIFYKVNKKNLQSLQRELQSKSSIHS